MASKNLILLGDLKAQCACGGWEFQGVLAEARKAIEQIHASHKWSCPLEFKKKAPAAAAKKKRK